MEFSDHVTEELQKIKHQTYYIISDPEYNTTIIICYFQVNIEIFRYLQFFFHFLYYHYYNIDYIHIYICDINGNYNIITYCITFDCFPFRLNTLPTNCRCSPCVVLLYLCATYLIICLFTN